MIGNNSCGVHSIMAGKTDANTEELNILLYDGTRMKVGKTSDEELAQIIPRVAGRGNLRTAQGPSRQICRPDSPTLSEYPAAGVRV